MEALVDEVKGLIISDQAIGHNERTQIHHSLSSIQSTQALPIISSQCIIDRQSSLQSARILRDRRRFTARPNGTPFWMSPRLQSWNQPPSSALLAVKVALRDRQLVQDFCTNIIEQLLKSRIAIFWVLKRKDETHSIIDALKSLIHQAVNLTYTSQAENKALLSFQLDRFIGARMSVTLIHLPIAVNVKNDGMEGTAFQVAGLSEKGRSHINNDRRGSADWGTEIPYLVQIPEIDASGSSPHLRDSRVEYAHQP
ncbi:hypothetical protein VTN00DRAFT_5284 [Thermoascus crustaceus]|uniref:uncharacterized protein n=1 Tax=Thermoascus crustaceus TaxID=5088 RepID=UPI003744B033